MRKFLYHVALDKWGQIVATHNPTPDGRNPLVAPEGGSLRSVAAEDLAELQQGARSKVHGARPRELKPAPDLRDVIRAARWKIAEEATKVRDRKIKGLEFAPLKGAELARQMDIAILFAAGRLKARDMVLVTNWSDGTMNKSEVKVGEWLDAIERGFRLRQEIRRRELAARAALARVYRDASLSDEAKIAAIEKLDIPEHLALDQEAVKSIAKTRAME